MKLNSRQVESPDAPRPPSALPLPPSRAGACTAGGARPRTHPMRAPASCLPHRWGAAPGTETCKHQGSGWHRVLLPPPGQCEGADGPERWQERRPERAGQASCWPIRDGSLPDAPLAAWPAQLRSCPASTAPPYRHSAAAWPGLTPQIVCVWSSGRARSRPGRRPGKSWRRMRAVMAVQ